MEDKNLREIQKLKDITSEELTEDDLVEKSASEPRPEKEEDVEEAVTKQIGIKQSCRRLQIIQE